jgi:hypothetical protein
MIRVLTAVCFVLVVLATVETAYQRSLAGQLPSLAQQAQFGDSFGGLNTLFSGCAFFGIIVTLFIQFDDIKWQRKCFALQQQAQGYQVNLSLLATYLSLRSVGRGNDAVLDRCEKLLESHLETLFDHPERLNAAL